MNSVASASEIFAPDLLRGNVALITGGGTGLGKATAHELARCGAAVTITGRRPDVLEQAAREISQAPESSRGQQPVARGSREPGAGGGREPGAGGGHEPGARGGHEPGTVDWVVGDVREQADAQRLVQHVLDRHGRLDLLVNNAGGQYFTPAELIVAKGWRAVWRLNVGGIINMAEAAYQHAMSAARGGTIVNVTLSPHHGMPGMAHSGAARASVEALTRELAARWADDGISVTAVAAGHFDTEVLAKYPAAVRAGTARSVPLQRLGAPAEHAWLIALLASPLGRAFSGSTVTLDGARDNWAGPWPPAGLADQHGEVPSEERR